jgi:hypothetical protein
MGAKRNVYKAMVVKPERKMPLGRPRCGREDNTEMYIRRIESASMGWINLTDSRCQ